MSPFSSPVLLPSLALCSPVLLDAYSGATTWSDALSRFLLVLGVWWLAVSVVHAVAFSPTRQADPDLGEPGQDHHEGSVPGGGTSPAGLG